MTDNEIIKALECCSKPYCNGNKCPLYKNTINTKDCITQLGTNALDLIKRQQAENYELQRKNLELQRKNLAMVKLKSEAIKEFAERLKEKCGYIAWDGISPAMVDDLVEEMTVNYESSKTDKQRKEDGKNENI